MYNIRYTIIVKSITNKQLNTRFKKYKLILTNQKINDYATDKRGNIEI